MLFRVSIADQFLFTVPRHDVPVYLVYFYIQRRVSPVPTRTAARAPPPAPGTRADRDRRGAPPPGIPPGSAHRPLAPRLRRARAPSPGQTPAPGWRGLNGRDPTRGPHAHRASDPKPAGAARGACVVARGGIDRRGRGRECHAVPTGVMPPVHDPTATSVPSPRHMSETTRTPTRRTLPFTHPTRPARTVPHTYAVRLHDGSTHTASTHTLRSQRQRRHRGA